jgi:methylated-DNA-[protein]-cysteine S-methyltransferase
MIKELEYFYFNTNMGWIGILKSTTGLLCTTLPKSSVEQVLQLLGSRVNTAVWCPQLSENLVERLRLYFNGSRVEFLDKIDLSQISPFQKKVLETSRLIPFGETRSYGWVAKQIQQTGAARAVGQALSRNPLPIIIPCHRVLSSDGKIGGFGGGISMKRQLLHLETSASTIYTVGL